MRKASRVWLNPAKHWDTGMVQWSVSAEDDPIYSSPEVDAEFSIWDCSRKISLSFDFRVYRAKEIKERIEKLDILQKELDKFRAAMGEAYEKTINNQKEKESSEVYSDDY